MAKAAKKRSRKHAAVKRDLRCKAPPELTEALQRFEHEAQASALPKGASLELDRAMAAEIWGSRPAKKNKRRRQKITSNKQWLSIARERWPRNDGERPMEYVDRLLRHLKAAASNKRLRMWGRKAMANRIREAETSQATKLGN